MKFQDQFGDRTSLEKKIVGYQTSLQEKDDNLDQLQIEKDMWKSKHDELLSVQADKVILDFINLIIFIFNIIYIVLKP